ncbi:MAG: TetR/AcrR family transcriptional regulator, partial [Alphaproteobacteria bacterium]|nr:TetR/AcrR family transcriptional regulator [Alphaproteobacteria bacterium]
MMARTGINGAKRGKRLRRVEKQEATLRALLDAAARVVGRDGYAGASVAKITALAGVAQGTFYNYFRSRQDLFDRLLPELGGRLLETIRERLAGCRQGLKREEIGFRAFFDFLVETPSFYRVLNEAEVFAPKAFRDHMANMADGYLRALRISRAKGDLPGYGD